MTENEEKAVKFIKNIRHHAVVTLDHIEKEEPNVSPLVYKGREEKADTILKMLDELQQYRSLGTPEELQDMKNNYFAALSDWRHYRKIGTVEECLRNKDFLDFLADNMNPGDFEAYLSLYNVL